LENNACLPFTWANWLVHGLGKWYAKFRTGYFHPFTICTNDFHLLKHDSEGVKLVSKLALKKWNINFVLEYFVRHKGKSISDVPLLLEIFHWKDPKSRVPFTF